MFANLILSLKSASTKSDVSLRKPENLPLSLLPSGRSEDISPPGLSKQGSEAYYDLAEEIIDAPSDHPGIHATN